MGRLWKLYKNSFMIKAYRFLMGIALLVGINACAPEATEIEEISVNFHDPGIQKLLDFQNQQNSDSLLSYLDRPSANLRYHAALAFASFQDSTFINPLAAHLDDPHPEVRAAVAYAIGQTGSRAATNVLVEAFDPYDTVGVYRLANSHILEGVGKCGDEESLELLANITTYQKSDTLLLQGQTRGIYELALKGTISEKGTQRMLAIVSDESFPTSVRLIAANYLYRARNLELEDQAENLSQLIFREKNPNIRMALVIALGKTKQASALAALEQRFKMESDYRVKCNIIRAMANFDYEAVKESIQMAVKDPNPHVALTAANYCLNNGDPSDASNYWRISKDSISARAVPIMYAAAQRHLPPYLAEYRQGLNGELRRLFRETEDVYQKAGFLSAMAEFGWNYRFVHREGFASESPVVRTKSVELLKNIVEKPDFRTFFGVNYRNVRREISVFFKDAIRSNDAGMIATAAQALENIGQGPRDYLIKIDSSFIQDALIQLDLPKEQEAYNILLRSAKRFGLDNLPDASVEAGIDRTIDWKSLQDLPKSPVATITTNKGDINIELWPEIAPATVANFVKLSQEGFYKEIPFHRVVSNFVVQAGCDRGDGNGGVPYTIRSEFKPVRFEQAGLVGMARTEKLHSESSQFFITHSPTPHLSGDYTVFGQLQGGEQVLNELLQGDRILSVVIK